MEIRLPNEDSFYPDDRAEVELVSFSGDVCMENCKESTEITMRAAVLDVTPEETKAKELEQAIASVRNSKPAKDEAQEETVVASAEAEIETPEIDVELAAAGEKSFRQCKACHQVGEGAKNRSGPVLNGVVDRAAGTADSFRYSKPMLAAADDGLIWTTDELVAFLSNPRGYLKGTKMSFRGFKDEADAQAVVEYLRTFAAPG